MCRRKFQSIFIRSQQYLIIITTHRLHGTDVLFIARGDDSTYSNTTTRHNDNTAQIQQSDANYFYSGVKSRIKKVELGTLFRFEWV